MKNPPHVGGLIRREVIEALGLTVTEAAKALNVGRQALSTLLNEKRALLTSQAWLFSPAVRIARDGSLLEAPFRLQSVKAEEGSASLAYDLYSGASFRCFPGSDGH